MLSADEFRAEYSTDADIELIWQFCDDWGDLLKQDSANLAYEMTFLEIAIGAGDWASALWSCYDCFEIIRLHINALYGDYEGGKGRVLLEEILYAGMYQNDIRIQEMIEAVHDADLTLKLMWIMENDLAKRDIWEEPATYADFEHGLLIG